MGEEWVWLGRTYARVGRMVRWSEIKALPNLYTFLLAWIFLSDGEYPLSYSPSVADKRQAFTPRPTLPSYTPPRPFECQRPKSSSSVSSFSSRRSSPPSSHQ